MSDAVVRAIAAARALRASPGYASLKPDERARLERDLGQLESALLGPGAPRYGQRRAVDPFAIPMETPADLGRAYPPASSGNGQTGAAAPPAAAAPPRPPGTEVIGERARAALDAVDFPAFVAGLIHGTFQAIVDATTQQVREYARLVADIAQSVDAFSRGNVSDNQVRDWLSQRYPQDLKLVLPRTGEAGSPQLLPRGSSPESPDWLGEFGLEGEELTPELTEGALLGAARNTLGEERMQSLATMVLLGVNRIVVNDGEIKARLQFSASAKESVNLDVMGAGVSQGTIASQQTQPGGAVSMKVSTVSLNAQADVAVRANLVGEVAIKFRSETFNLNSFADTQAIELINRHSRLRSTNGASAPAPAGQPPLTPPPAAPAAPEPA